MKKTVIIGVVLLLLLGGAGAASWWFLLREPPQEALAGEDAEERQAPKEMVFVDFEPMIISVLRGGQATNHLTFMIILQVADTDGRSRVFRSTLRLRDAFRSELHALLSRRFMEDRPDLMQILSKRLKEVSEREVGKKVVTRVLINVMTKRDFVES